MKGSQVVALVVCLVGTSSHAWAQGAGAAVPSGRQVLDDYCVSCHNARVKSGNLVLQDLDPEHVAGQVDTWEKVVKKLKGRVMPPPGSRRPDAGTYDRLVVSLESKLDALAAASPNPGRPLIHRLNRAEYANAIRDLLGLDIDAAALLPADTSGYGFDNVADVLTMSPGLLDRYMSAAGQISRRAVGDPTIRPQEQTYRVSGQSWQDDRLEGLPFGTRGGVRITHYFPLTGEYVFRIDPKRGYYDDIVGRHEPNDVDLSIDGLRATRFRIEPTTVQTYTGDEKRPGDRILEVRVPVQAGAHDVGVAIVKRSSALTEGIGPARLPITVGDFPSMTGTSTEMGKLEMRIATLAIQGPFVPDGPGTTGPRRRIFVCEPSAASGERACAQRIMSRLARLAYRRPVEARDVTALMAFYDRGAEGGGFEAGVQLALERLLITPAFLFRAERTPAGVPSGGVHRISDTELASRLSFFLWSSIPDEPLLQAAEQDRLHDPRVLQQQVQRMMKDSRAEALIANFFGQWLFLRNLRLHAPDRQMFPDFDEELRQAFERETSLFLASQIGEDHPVTDLFSADYTFLNERLARHYGIPGVVGSQFRRVSYPDGRRGGLLGHGSILAVTSYTNRTSVVQRGKWILDNVLGTPPPDPPPGVPPLTDNVDGKLTSVRARMEHHRRNPVCATCHSQIDPMGFALENFDGIGAWRETDSGTRIDPSGSFPDGTKFDGPQAFRALLLQRQDALVTTLTEKLLTYALGRGLEGYDMPAVRAIVRDARAGLRWSALVAGIVQSTPFQMRRAES